MIPHLAKALLRQLLNDPIFLCVISTFPTIEYSLVPPEMVRAVRPAFSYLYPSATRQGLESIQVRIVAVCLDTLTVPSAHKREPMRILG